jgi:hypothetical protein
MTTLARMNWRFQLALSAAGGLAQSPKYPSYPDDKKLELDKMARVSFSRVINREVPTHFESSEVKKCGVGPFKQETSLDRIQRINYILYSIKSLASPSKWKDYHLSKPKLCKLFDEPAPVTASIGYNASTTHSFNQLHLLSNQLHLSGNQITLSFNQIYLSFN